LEALEEKGALHRIPRGQFLVPPGQLARPADAVSAAVAGQFASGAKEGGAATEEEGDEEEKATHGRDARDTHGRDAHATAVLRWAVAHRPGALRAAAWGLFAHRRRWGQAACDSYDGRIAEPALVHSLAEQFGPQAVFSASQLNTFGQCPWRFFASYVLKLAPLEEPQRRLEPLTRGSMCHDVLQGVFSRLAKDFGSPVLLGQIGAATVEQALQEAMAEQARRIDLRRPPYPALWKILQSQVLRQLRDYLESQREDPAWQPESLHFELAFGMKEGAAFGREDPASNPSPVSVATSAGAVLVRGKIDRLDRIAPRGEGRLLVVDYKTGALPKPSDILEGRNLQIPLYAAAAEQLLKQPCMGGVFHGIGREINQRWFASLKPARGGGMAANDDYGAQLSQAMSAVGRFVEAIRGGRFDLFPVHECPGYCPFRRICQFSQARAEYKSPEAAP
jgi:ATP-dependent helicase/nuclease subunit B